MTFDWTCPFCSRNATLTEESTHSDSTVMSLKNAIGPCKLVYWFNVCPNPKCKKYTLSASLHRAEWDKIESRWVQRAQIHFWSLIPTSNAQSFPDYVPAAIIEDYNEACLIRDLSPKASATLARRCLQGILRDFWKVKPGRLVDEIEAIKSKVDPLTWGAIEAVRKVGNIGAHMEKDINLMVDVEPQEAQLLIGLIEVLIKDWYIAQENRKVHLNAIITVASQKEKEKQQQPVVAAAK
jgi:hypothetical protein